jgi:hypothetical protein
MIAIMRFYPAGGLNNVQPAERGTPIPQQHEAATRQLQADTPSATQPAISVGYRPVGPSTHPAAHPSVGDGRAFGENRGRRSGREDFVPPSENSRRFLEIGLRRGAKRVGGFPLRGALHATALKVCSAHRFAASHVTLSRGRGDALACR